MAAAPRSGTPHPSDRAFRGVGPALSSPAMGSDTIFTVREAKGGDGDAWRKLIHKVREVVTRRTDRRDLPPSHDLDDIVQIVLHDVVRSLRDFDVDAPGASFRGWVAVILKRRLLDLWRKARSPKRGNAAVQLLGDYEAAGDEPFEPADDRWIRQSVIFRGLETEACVQRQMAKLSEDDRTVLRLREDDGMSFPDMMRVLGVDNEGTVRSRYARACKRREELVRPCFRDSDATGGDPPG